MLMTYDPFGGHRRRKCKHIGCCCCEDPWSGNEFLKTLTCIASLPSVDIVMDTFLGGGRSDVLQCFGQHWSVLSRLCELGCRLFAHAQPGAKNPYCSLSMRHLLVTASGNCRMNLAGFSCKAIAMGPLGQQSATSPQISYSGLAGPSYAKLH